MAETSTSWGDILVENCASRDRHLFQCRVAEMAERYDDMVKFISEVCRLTNDKLSTSERNFLSVAFKNAVGARRSSLRCLVPMKNKYKEKGARENEKVISEYETQILGELRSICSEALDLIEKVILRNDIVKKEDQQRTGLSSGAKDANAAPAQGSSTTAASDKNAGGSENPTETLEREWCEFHVFFIKMQADYHRYLAEFSTGDEKAEAVTNSRNKYKAAVEKAQALGAAHPIKLGLMLNYSVFLYEIDEKTEEAVTTAKNAFDVAINGLGQSTDNSQYKDATLILQLIRDNLSLWTSAKSEEQAGQPQQPEQSQQTQQSSGQTQPQGQAQGQQGGQTSDRSQGQASGAPATAASPSNASGANADTLADQNDSQPRRPSQGGAEGAAPASPRAQ